MKSFGQFCPLAQAAQLLCERWTLLVVREMVAGSTRFNELRKGVPQMSPTLLSARLKQLVEHGVVARTGSPGKYVYTLTRAGQDLEPIVQLLGAWGHRWAPSTLAPEDLDAGLLMWDMRRSVNPAAFPDHKVVVQYEFWDAPDGSRNWWLVSEHHEVELCLGDPGIDIDILIRSSLKTMTAVWTCQMRFSDAVKNGDIAVHGNAKLAIKLADWLQSSALSRLGASGLSPDLAWHTA